MSWFSRNDEDLVRREKELEQKYSDIKNLLQHQQNEIADRFQQLGNLDAAIMTKSNLEVIYQQQVEALEAQKQSLTEAITNYQAGATQYAEKFQELLKREEQVVARESAAEAAFSEKFAEQMQPLNALKNELDAKHQRVVTMQEEFNKNFFLQDQKLMADFQRMQGELQSRFDELQQQLLTEREALSQRSAALNDRETEVLRRENEIRQGLADEKTAMLAEIQVARARLQDDDAKLKAQADEVAQRQKHIEEQEASLASRIAAVQERENAAEAGFARERQELLAQLQQTRTEQQTAIAELQKQAVEQNSRMLMEWSAQMDAERAKLLGSLSAELEERRNAMNDLQAKCDDRQQKLSDAEKALAEREAALELEKLKLEERTKFLEEKERIISDKFQHIAEERIAAAHAEAQAASSSRDELRERLATLMMENIRQSN